MAKIIKYKFPCEVNHGTEEQPDIEQIIFDKSMVCHTQAIFDANYPIAEREAVGEIIVEGEFDPESSSDSDSITWNELDMAYTDGINSL